MRKMNEVCRGDGCTLNRHSSDHRHYRQGTDTPIAALGDRVGVSLRKEGTFLNT
jgi:hypothetical protein